MTIAVVVVSVTLVGGPLFVRRAQAQTASTVVADVPKQVETVLDQILTALTRAGVVAFFNAAQVFFGQLAYDAATALASGGKGQGALVYEKGFGDYMAGVAGDTAGEFIGSLSDDSFFEGIGFDLCRPPDVRNLLNIQLSFGNIFPGNQGRFDRPRPSCDFQDIINNYEQLYTTLTNAEVTDFVNASFQPGGSDLSVSASIFGRGIGKISGDTLKKQLDRSETGAFKNIEGQVSGFTKTPASLVEQQTKTALIEQPSADQGQVRNTILQNAFEEGAIQLAIYTASVFLNTLTQKLMERVFEDGLVGVFDFSGAGEQLTRPDSISVAGKTDARKANIALRDVQLIKTSDIELISELIACPENRGTWNCVVDEGLAQAIQTESEQGNYTIKQALEQGLLHGEWRLLPKTFARENLDPQCYTYAYCSGNLQKLRALRILPVGFELAANSAENIERCGDVRGCVTLDEAVRGFSDCDATGERDEDHPWCKLIDPNWVLTSFPQQCQLSGFGDTLLTRRLPQRAEECRDIQTCLQRNDKGECVGGYGYCVAEKNVYRFNADECPAEYASCRNFTSRSGQSVSFVRNTLDYSVCSAENVGCLAYATDRDGATDEWVDAGERIYFDANVETCPANAEGCTELRVAEVGQSSLNFALNGSFEIVVGSAETAEFWTPPTPVVTSVPEGQPGRNGSASLALAPATTYSQEVTLVAGRVYTLSYYARSGAAPAASNRAQIGVRELRADGTNVPNTELDLNFRSSGCDAVSGARVTSNDVGFTWARYQCSFLAATTTARGIIEIRQAAGNVLVDAVQLEESEFATNFVDGLNLSMPVVHMRVAPDEYNCTGADTDNPKCANFARMCRQSDAGCQGYTNVSGGPEIPAILSANDLCPASCVGYAEYRKAASAFDLVVDADPRFNDPSDASPSYFIAATGEQCSQEDVGCELFTNIEAAAAGGESTTAFNYLRSCQTPNDFTETYFTWEGSEDAGFQLRTWSLIRDGGAGSAPRVLEKRSPDGSFKEPGTCDEALWRSGVDPDCRQFYNAAGDVFYRYFSQTILSTDECTSWRLPRSNTDDCSKTGGAYNPGTGECVYQVYVPTSRTCRAEFAGCRAYMGAAAGNVQNVLQHNFRDGVTPFESGTQSPESLLVGDSSLRIDPVGGRTETSVVVADTEPEQLFRAAFWAKAPGRTDVVATLLVADGNDPAATPVAVGSIRIGTDWQRYDMGLFNGAAGATASRIFWTFTSAAGAPTVFIDEVFVNRVNDIAYVVKDSWNTPNECNQSNAGAPEPQAMLGCSQYRDRFGNTINAYRFTNLCSGNAIGCRAFVDTRDSDAVGPETFVMEDDVPVPVFNDPADTFGANTTTRPADRMLYLIYEESKLCQPENASCRAFGRPTYAPDRSGIEEFQTVYFKDDISRYGEMLCRPSEEFCEAFTYNSAPDYFRDPQTHVCEYRNSVRLSGTDFPAGDPLATLPAEEIIYSGWFVKGEDYPCYPSNLEGGTFFNISRRGDTNYQGWVAMCPREQGECTEFRDPNDTTDPIYRESGRPYFFIQNNKLDKASCAGNIDVGAGCILLRDQSNTALTYSLAASYHAYEANDFEPTRPLNCAQTPAHPSCVATNSTTTDANVLLKVNIDRDCSQWLGCESAESVYDPATRQFKDVCVSLALCDKSTQIPGDIFCANYVDRHPSNEPIMSQGNFFDINAYTAREVGLGAQDYSGYAIPNAFQIPDLVSTRVGAEGANDVANNEHRFALDYRLAAQAMIPVSDVGTVAATAGAVGNSEAFVLDSDPVGIANPSLFLCRHKGTNLIGYYRESDRDNAVLSAISDGTREVFPCFLPVRNDVGDVSFHNISQKFSIDDPTTDRVLSAAFPVPECRAYPEADAPYAASVVTEWDFTTVPPTPVNVVEGFASANTCEYGEDCLCTYKRADYQGVDSKFFDILSQNVPPGICVGGPRNGQSCLPSAIFNVGTGEGESAASLVNGVLSANAAQTCGSPLGGGQCIPFSKLEIIRGVFGQCLERDTTRILGGDITAQPCLTWNPTPILFGDKDPFHYQPTSGYLPPQNSGQYYCASAAKKPATYELNQIHFKRFIGHEPAPDARPTSAFGFTVDFEATAILTLGFGGPIFGFTDEYANYENQFRGSDAKYAGQMTRMDYDEQWVSPDNRCWPDECNFQSPSLFGISAQRDGGVTAQRCEQADDEQANNRDLSALRLVDAGRGYSETFFRINDSEIAILLGASGTRDYINLLNDNTISYFKISPIENGEKGRLACGYQEEWVDNMPSTSYNNKDSLSAAESVWREEFFRNYNPYMTRGSEDILRLQSGEPVVTRCVADSPTSTECNFKTWEISYRNENKEKSFYGIFSDTSRSAINRSFMNIRQTPVVDRCETDKPYFGIRAVFQAPDDPAVDEPAGPWRFVGFWVSACGGDTGGDQRYIYMSLEMGSVSVCDQLAEVRSAASNSDAAFTDRVWAQGGFREPATGIQYSARSSPFSSALNTGPAGDEPLFQAGFELAGFSPLDPPIFLQAGDQTYYRDKPEPNEKYQYLTNLFARIYRVYRFHFQPVSKDGNACLAGPFKGVACTNPGGSDPACNVDGVCDPALLSLSDKFDLRVCNRSVSRNIVCASNDTICQAPSFYDGETGEVVSLRNNCIPSPVGGDPSGTFRCDTSIGSNVGHHGDLNPANQPFCSFQASNSPECPVAINGSCPGSSGARFCTFGPFDVAAINAHPSLTATSGAVDGNRIACTRDDDCRFTLAHYSDPSESNRSSCVVGTEVSGFGRCRGGLKENGLCRTDASGSIFTCDTDIPAAAKTEFRNSCGAVGTGPDNTTPVAACQHPERTLPNDDPELDNNICTHGIGYVPRLDLCPNPDDEYCGLVAYKISGTDSQESLNPTGRFPQPTDVTMGHYTPYFVGWTGSSEADLFRYLAYYNPRPPRIAAPDTRNCPVPGQCPVSVMDAFTFNGQAEGSINAGGGQHKSTLRFYAWAEHNQMPLRRLSIDWGDQSSVVLDDTKLKNRKPFCSVLRECSDPIRGQGLTCQTDADCPPGAGQCLPLGTCEANPSRTCRRDADCSVGGVQDTCRIRTMFGNSGEACQADYFDFTHVYNCGALERATLPDCTTGAVTVPPNTCYWGDVQHGFLTSNLFGGTVSCTTLADCTAAITARGETLPAGSSCGPTADPGLVEVNRCSRNPELVCNTSLDCPIGDDCLPGLAPVDGCFDATSNSCRYTPRLMLEDNWGWCTGECRTAELAGTPIDVAGARVRHTYGGCYSGSVLGRDVTDANIRYNTRSSEADPGVVSRSDHYVLGYTADTYNNGECSVALPQGGPGVPVTRGGSTAAGWRPWIVYPGSIQVRFSGESAE